MRTVLSALMLCLGLFLVGGMTSAAQAQSYDEANRMLWSRILPDDLKLIQKVQDDRDNRSATKADVIAVFARGFEYFERRDYFSANKMFYAGFMAYTMMEWPADDVNNTASSYLALSTKRFCEIEAVLCKAYYSNEKFGDERFPEIRAAEMSLVGFYYAPKLESIPMNLRAAVAKECAEAQQHYRRLVESNPAYLKIRGERSHPPVYYVKYCG